MKNPELLFVSLLLVLLSLTAQSASVSFETIRVQSHGVGKASHPYDNNSTLPIVSQSLQNDVTPVPLRMLPPSTSPPLTSERNILTRAKNATSQIPMASDPVVQRVFGAGAMPAASKTIGGITMADDQSVLGYLWIAPPDTNGAVGPRHYVQIVNVLFAVYDKTSGNRIFGPVGINTIWSGFGGACQNDNDGDPIVLYDHFVDRWLISQFALPSYPSGPSYECVAISQTGDPTGNYYRYAFLISTSQIDDYPKISVWPDAYYLSANQFGSTGNYNGIGAVAFERAKMLVGQAARMVYFNNPVPPGGHSYDLYSMLPSDADGTSPPAGSTDYYVQSDDTYAGYPQDQLEIWAFHVDWTNPAVSTFTRVTLLPTATFDSNLCNYYNAGYRNCITQKGTGQGVDALSDRLMYRLAFRSFRNYQSMVVSQAVNVGTNPFPSSGGIAGMRWYELRNSGGGWSIYQQSTYSPDSTNRWMGSIAMDNAGDMALGYSISNSSVYPSIAYTGRLAGDPLNTMTQSESTLVAGTGSQTNWDSWRWGDYSSMSIDPVDDCTFWYTQEYYEYTPSGSNGYGWWTFIGSFKFPSCVPATALPYNVTLHAGWNLVSLPIVPDNPTITTLLSPLLATGNLLSVWAYTGTPRSWKFFIPGTTSTLATMNDGIGYWINLRSAYTLYISGSVIAPVSTPPSYSLSLGWNLVGFKPEPAIANETVIDYLSSIAGQYDTQNVWLYDNSSGAWIRTDDLTWIHPWQAMWILVTVPTTLLP